LGFFVFLITLTQLLQWFVRQLQLFQRHTTETGRTDCVGSTVENNIPPNASSEVLRQR